MVFRISGVVVSAGCGAGGARRVTWTLGHAVAGMKKSGGDDNVCANAGAGAGPDRKARGVSACHCGPLSTHPTGLESRPLAQTLSKTSEVTTYARKRSRLAQCSLAWHCGRQLPVRSEDVVRRRPTPLQTEGWIFNCERLLDSGSCYDCQQAKCRHVSTR